MGRRSIRTPKLAMIMPEATERAAHRGDDPRPEAILCPAGKDHRKREDADADRVGQARLPGTPAPAALGDRLGEHLGDHAPRVQDSERQVDPEPREQRRSSPERFRAPSNDLRSCCWTERRTAAPGPFVRVSSIAEDRPADNIVPDVAWTRAGPGPETRAAIRDSGQARRNSASVGSRCERTDASSPSTLRRRAVSCRRRSDR